MHAAPWKGACYHSGARLVPQTQMPLSGSDCMTFWDVRSDLAFTFDMAAITNESGFATEAKYSDNDSPRASLRVSLVV